MADPDDAAEASGRYCAYRCRYARHSGSSTCEVSR
jgi:hypothetical protein